MKLLDLYSGAGGAARGYQQAGFHVTGVDNRPQPHYCGDAFVQADALEYLAEHGGEYDAIHASPPCQFASEITPLAARAKHPNLIPVTRSALQATGKAYVIENVDGARRWLNNPVLLCGSMFGLRVWRHRWFETVGFWALSGAGCAHIGHPVTVHGGSNARRAQGRRQRGEQERAMGIDWMTEAELTQAIPPAYTRYIGAQLLRALADVPAAYRA